MAKGLRESLKLNKISKKKLTIFALAVISIGIAGGVTFAKYYANNSNKGVTAAANYYFSSDVLDEAINKQDNPQAGQEKWKDVYNTKAWDGKSAYDFNLKIRNYENQLLYNSDNLDVTYTITFTLLEDDEFDGGAYKVGDGRKEVALTQENPSVEFEEVIEGGTATSDMFHVMFTAPTEASEDYQSEGVQVVAEITGPDFLAKTETRIGGVLHVGKVEAEYSLVGTYDFTDADDITTNGDVWTEEEENIINAMAAFPYSVTYNPGTDNAAHQVQISWNSNYLQLDQFNENYRNVDEGASSFTVYIQPNGTLKLTFYRTDAFTLEAVSPAEFWQLVTVTDLDHPTTND